MTKSFFDQKHSGIVKRDGVHVAKLKLAAADTKTDKLLAKRASKKVATGLEMTEEVRDYFLKNKDVTFRNDKAANELIVRGKYVDGDVYIEKVPLLATKEALFAFVNISREEHQGTRLCILWNSVKQFGSVDAMRRRMTLYYVEQRQAVWFC